MFSWIKGMISGGSSSPREASPEELAAMEAFDRDKQKSLDEALEKMEDTVLHALIPFFIGGTLDLYLFRNFLPGTLYVTQELFTPDPKGRPKKSKAGWFELAAAYRDDSDQTDAKGMTPSIRSAGRILNPIARYASMASLGPGETAEIPGDEGEPNTCIVFDRVDLGGKTLSASGEAFFLLLVIQIHPQELAFARAHKSAELFKRLKASGYYPYSDLDRPSVA